VPSRISTTVFAVIAPHSTHGRCRGGIGQGSAVTAAEGVAEVAAFLEGVAPGLHGLSIPGRPTNALGIDSTGRDTSPEVPLREGASTHSAAQPSDLQPDQPESGWTATRTEPRPIQ